MRLSSVVAIALTVSPALAQTVIPHEHTIHSTTDAGQEVKVFTYAQWHRDCRPMPPPQIAMRSPPAHGTVSLRPGQSLVRVIREGAADCTGKTYDGLAVWYAPAPGFHGIETFDWDVLTGTSQSHDTGVVTVR